VDNILANDVIVVTGLALGTELDNAFLESKEGIVLSNTDISAREVVCATLSEDDLTNADLLAMVRFDPKVLWI
jgi:hypothetical protein